MAKFNSFLELTEFSSQYGLDARGCSPQDLTISKGVIKIPLEPTYGRNRVRCLKVTLLQSGNKVLSGLLWHACFGKKFKLVHNMIFFEILQRTSIYSPLAQTVFDLMVHMNSTAKAGSNENLFWQNLSPVRKNVPDSKLQEVIARLESSGIKLPTKEPQLDNLVRLTEGVILQRKPKPVNRIGVGYKDKGTLNSSSPYEPDEITPFSAPSVYNLWSKLVKNHKRI